MRVLSSATRLQGPKSKHICERVGAACLPCPELLAILRVGLKFFCVHPNCVAIRRNALMLKFALAAGIVYEWLFGAAVSNVASLEFAAMRTLCATLLAWMVLESARTLFLAAMSLDDRPAADRRDGAAR